MIIEFVLSASLGLSPATLPEAEVPLVNVEFSNPVRRVITYPPVGILDRKSGLELPEGTREAFEFDFADGTMYFGAFAITKDFGYGYVTGSNSIEAAREIAMEECLKQGPVCLIYAEILPQGYQPLNPGEVSLAAEAGAYYTNPDPSWGSFRAMAVSEDGAYSVVWNHGTPREATAAALADCEQYTINDLPNLRDMPCVLVPFK